MRAGIWTECINPMRKKVSHYWFKKIGYKHDFCDLCLYEIQKRNGTLLVNNTGSPINHRPDSKPEKDSL